MLFAVAWSFAALTISYRAFGQNQVRSISVPNYSDIGYLEHLPNDYNQNTEHYPVLIFLHGAGERGNGTSDLGRVKKNGPPKHIENGHPMTFTVDGREQSLIVISPQLRSDYNSWPGFYVDLVVEHIKKTYRVDEDRIYLTGLSMGGGATWSYTSYKAEYAKKIAAIVPICGHQSYNASKVGNIADNKVAVWALHGDADSNTPLRYSQDWVNGINNRASFQLAKLTVYSGVSHSGAWQRGYKIGHEYHDPNIYEWLLQQHRGTAPAPVPSPAPVNQPPVAEAGANVTVQLPIQQATLDGSTSQDADGTLATYTWKQISGSTSVSLSSLNNQILTVANLQEGEYGFELQVTDNQGATDTDQVLVVVAEAPVPTPIPSPNDDCNCDHTITAAKSYVDGKNLGVKPGDVICIQAGDYSYLNLFNFEGTAEQPLLFKNCGGQVRIGGPDSNYGIVMNNNRHFRFTGTGDSHHKYGFKVDGQTKHLSSGFAIATKSSDFEIDHLEITKVKAGVLAKTNPSCDPSTWNGNYVMRNVKFHDFYIHNIEGEGFYIGHTSLKVNVTCDGTIQEVVPHNIEHIRVYDNVLEHTGWDGIQVSRASQDCEIYNNRVYDYGTVNMSSQQAGIIVGGESVGKVYNNWVEKGTGSGIQIFGTGEVNVYNNVVTDAGEDAIFCDDRSPQPMLARFINNTIVNPTRDGIRLYNDKAVNNVVCNNLIVAPGSLGAYDSNTSSYLFVANGVNLTKSTNHFSATADKINFKDHVNDDFQLKGSSPAVDAGTNVNHYGIVEDCEGNARPANGAYDIGAFEAAAILVPNPTPGPTSNPEPIVKATGLDYAYYEGEWTTVPNFVALTATKTGTVATFDLGVREQDNNFAVLFTGYINIPATGEYTFITGSDDGSKLYIGGHEEQYLVVDNDGLHGLREQEGTVYLTEGLHPITVAYFEKGGNEILKVKWKNTAHGVTNAEEIPSGALFRDKQDEAPVDVPTQNSNGLNYAYYEGNWAVVPNFDELVAVKTGTVSAFNLSIRDRDDEFAVLFTGYIRIPATGDYTFITASDDGSKLYVGGYGEEHLIVDNDGLHGLLEREGTLHLTEGLHPIKVAFFEKRGDQILKVYWKNTAHGVTNAEEIPNEVLFSALDAAPPVGLPQDTIITEPEVTERTFQINITKSGSSSDLSDWYDIALDNISGSRTFTEITDTKGESANISVTIYHGVQGYTVLGVADNQVALDGGIYPNEVLRHAAYTTGKALIKLSDLDTDKLYNIRVLGGRAGSGERITNYIVNGVTKKIQCMRNTDQVENFALVSPDADGTIDVEFLEGGDTWAYINALVIEEVTVNSARVSAATDKIKKLPENNLQIGVSAYPNPFINELIVSLGDNSYGTVSVSLYNQVGNLVYQANGTALNSSQIRLNLRNRVLRSGIYVLEVKVGSNIIKKLRLIKV